MQAKSSRKHVKTTKLSLIFIIVIDQSLFAVDLNVNKLNVTLIWQKHTSDWQEYIGRAASAKTELAWLFHLKRCLSNLVLSY